MSLEDLPTINEYPPDDPPSTTTPKGKDIPNIHTCKTLPEIRSTLQTLHAHHNDVTTSLESAITTHEDTTARHLRRLDLTRARLSTLASTARTISNTHLATPAATASRISAAVSTLDLEASRVKATLEVVEQVATLKSCVLGVTGSMAMQDWEGAAEYLSRAGGIPSHVVDSGFAGQVVPTSEVPDAPRVTLDGAAESLCGLFLREFERAVQEGDGGGVTRYFKMFPLIGRGGEGLEAYGRYVCQGVAARARGRMQGAGVGVEGSFYTGAWTKLFEHIAQVVDGHAGLVERHYGTGTMGRVMERLHGEAERQGGIVLDTWWEERGIERILVEVKSYAYSFLVQSFLPGQKGFGGTPRTGSPAPGANNSSRGQDEEGVDMKEVDRVLSEAGAMLGHWSLYLRFVASSAQPHDNSEDPSKPLITPDFIKTSTLPKKITKTLTDPFNIFATFFLRRSVERAFQLDEPPSGLLLHPTKPVPANPPYITSAIDDVMYVVNQILQRALSTSTSEIVVSVSSAIGRVLGTDFMEMIRKKMRDESYPKATVQGTLPPDDKVLAFLVLINNLDVATDYIRRIVRSHFEEEEGASEGRRREGASPRPLEDLFPLGKDAVNVKNALRNLEGGFTAKANELITDGLSVTFQQVLKPRMRPLLIDAFRDTDYSTTEEEQRERNRNADDEYEDAGSSVKARMESSWDTLLKPAKRILTDRLAERLTATTTSQLATLLEKRIWSYYGRVGEVGAVALEKDISDVAGVATRGENFKIREAFNRCTQIVTVMNLEEDEWDAIRGAEGADEEWVLDERERVRARALVRGRE